MVKQFNILNIITYLGLIIGLVYACFPVVWMLFSSLKSNTEIFSIPPELFPKEFTLKAYNSIFSSPMKVRFFLNSYLVAMVVTLLTLFVAILAGYSFSRHSFKLKKPLNLFIISTQPVPPISLLIPYFGIVVAFRMYDTYFALVFTYMVFTLPYAILLMTGYFNTLPKELDEAVIIDGVQVLLLSGVCLYQFRFQALSQLVSIHFYFLGMNFFLL